MSGAHLMKAVPLSFDTSFLIFEPSSPSFNHAKLTNLHLRGNFALSLSRSLNLFTLWRYLMDKTCLHEQLSYLLQHAACGDNQAFRELYDLVSKQVYFYLLRMLGSKEAAEDVLVETFTVVWKSAEKFAGRSTVTTWIYGIARNLALNEIRRRKSHDPLEDHPNLAGGSVPDMEGSDRKRVLGLAMEKISARHREVLDLAFFHEMTYPEISDLIEVPVGTVKTRIFHAKTALRKALAEMKVDADGL